MVRSIGARLCIQVTPREISVHIDRVTRFKASAQVLAPLARKAQCKGRPIELSIIPGAPVVRAQVSRMGECIMHPIVALHFTQVVNQLGTATRSVVGL